MLTLQALHNVNAGYVLQVKAVSWNGTGFNALGECCDGYTWKWNTLRCDKSCDNSFLFCLRPFGYSKTSEHCPMGSFQTGILGANSISFNSSTIGASFSNPMNFTGSKWTVCNSLVLLVIIQSIEYLSTLY